MKINLNLTNLLIKILQIKNLSRHKMLFLLSVYMED